MACDFCGCKTHSVVFRYAAPPPGETRFAFSQGPEYRREMLQCNRCQHLVSRHDLPLEAIYEGAYMDATYAGDALRRSFERIQSLDPSQSDNAGRVRRVSVFADAFFVGRSVDGSPSILDVGSGLCVFLHRMKAAGWRCTALDPDPRAIRHAQEAVGVEAICADFMRGGPFGLFDAVSFNKVLEHVREPIPMLARAATCLRPGGFVYLELPDGEAALSVGPDREEFFIEHWHVFSMSSVALLAGRAGFMVVQMERLREPSGKYTLRAFLTPARRPADAPAGALEHEGVLNDAL
jgi:SAM-dependent methyltransferase